MSEQTNRKYSAYNEFDTRAIYDATGQPSNDDRWPGWHDDYTGDSTSTPITDENLNAMLNMLIQIRNVIGKTDEFAATINGDSILKPDTEVTYKASNPLEIDNTNNSIATYIKAVAEAIIGETDDDNKDTTIYGLINKIGKFNELDFKDIPANDIQTVTAAINTEAQVRHDQVIGLNKSLKEEVITRTNDIQTVTAAIGDLSKIDFGESVTVENLDSIIKIIQKEIDLREAADNETKKYVDEKILGVKSELGQELDLKLTIDTFNTEIAKYRTAADQDLIDARQYAKINNKADAATVKETTDALDARLSTLDEAIIIDHGISSGDEPNRWIDAVTLHTDTGSIYLKGDTYINDKKAATEEYVDNAVSDISLLDSSVKLEKPYILTQDFGYYKLNGSSSISIGEKAGGQMMTMQEFLQGALCKEETEDLIEKLPRLEITNTAVYKEIGASFSLHTPSSTNPDEDGDVRMIIDTYPGAYKYGPDTGVSFIIDKIEYLQSNNTYAEFTRLTPNTSREYPINVKITYNTSEGAIPNSNLGNPVDSQKISAQPDKTVTKDLIYIRKPILDKISYDEHLGIERINSDYMRDGMTDQALKRSYPTSVEFSDNWYQYFIAIPEGRIKSVSVKDSNNLPLTINKTSIRINHLGGKSSDYDLFYIDNAAQYAPTKLTFTWTEN